MMRLTAFRIRNFRSITDTGWQSLSPDNITCLIGQNESGKTSILEALKVFYTGVISEDVLRSDLSLPEVSCRFSIPEGWLLSITDNPRPELRELLAGLDSLELTRAWIADLSSVVKVSGAVSQYLDSLEDAWKIYLGDVTLRLEEEMDNIDVLEASLENISRQESLLGSQLPSRDPAKKPFAFLSRKNGEETADAVVNPELYSELDDLRDKKDRITNELENKKLVKKAGEKWKEILDRYSMHEKHMSDLFLKLEERHQKLTLLMKPFDDEDVAWKSVLHDYRKTREDRDMIKSELDRHIAFSGYLLNGFSEAESEEKVSEIIQSYKSQYNSEMLGRKYFAHCPIFEFFEDFSSLLPNRIDLHDIISGNEQVEGYKAARNFLTIARLDYSFFQQRSSRIFKQKIENINQTLTTDFQDFWQQSIGRNNKIHIQFELDHYDASAGRKSGKPYLEFWIKDEGERLYPKQRSRGVRWFLSFYLELKASANINREMVLLVDEPGVSLHARAQEDVLKVFEDIRERIQVVYTTHSPHLVEINKLHRVLAIQRDDIDSMRSSTKVLDPLQLSSATPDTLSPLQSILGNPLPVEGASPGKFNLIVNDNGTFYLISAILHLTGSGNSISVIPSTGVSSIPLLCNILMGWGLDFLVLLFRNDMEEDIVELLPETVYKPGGNGKESIIVMPENFHNSEDLLSTLDFKNHILKTREGITVANSDYVREKEMPRNFIFSRFLSEVMDGDIRLSDFDEETNENFRLFIGKLNGHK